VRHVRMLALCLAAVFAFSAVVASSAFAEEKILKGLKQFENCPVEYVAPVIPGEEHASNDCFYELTDKENGGFFKVGPITVPLSKQVVLQYMGARYINDESGFEHEVFVAPLHGVESITPTPEPVPGEPIANITAAEQEEMGWPEGLKHRYAEGQKHHTVRKVYETIEGAGPDETNTNNLVNEEGTAVEVPVRVKGENEWMAELGDVCYIGSDSEPIVQHFTSGTSISPLTGEEIKGKFGDYKVLETKKITHTVISDSTLVDNTYAVPGANCTGPYSEYIEATIDKAFGIPAQAGSNVTEITGTVYFTLSSHVKEAGY
jgi:hypothetical protein